MLQPRRCAKQPPGSNASWRQAGGHVIDNVHTLSDGPYELLSDIIETGHLKIEIGDGDNARTISHYAKGLNFVLFGSRDPRGQLIAHANIVLNKDITGKWNYEYYRERRDDMLKNGPSSSGRGDIMIDVKDDINEIEDRLGQRGLLKSATGDPDAEVSISFGDWDCGGEVGPHWIIEISSDNVSKKVDSKFEEISDFVNEKLSEYAEAWPSEVTSVTSDAWGQVVLLNGEQVY